MPRPFNLDKLRGRMNPSSSVLPSFSQTSLPATADVAVIGGGVIGAAVALELARRGASVVVLERGRVGYGCSYGNAGWLTPSLSIPLPAPGMFWKSLRCSAAW